MQAPDRDRGLFNRSKSEPEGLKHGNRCLGHIIRVNSECYTGGLRMKKMVDRLNLVFALIILAGILLPASAVFSSENNHKQITRELMALAEARPEIRNLLEASIAEA